MSKTEPYSHPL